MKPIFEKYKSWKKCPHCGKTVKYVKAIVRIDKRWVEMMKEVMKTIEKHVLKMEE